MNAKKFQHSRLAAAALIALASPFAAQIGHANGGGVGLAADGTAVQTYYANTYVSNADGKDGTTNAVRGLRKFVDTLPGVALPGGATGVLGGMNNLGQYLPLAISDTTSYLNSDYYEIAVVEYAEKMHSDLVKPTTLRGYVQIDRAMTNSATVDPAAVTAYNQYLVALSAYNAKLAAYQAYQSAAAAYAAAAPGLTGAQTAYTSAWTTYNASVLALQAWTTQNNQAAAAAAAKVPADAMLQSCATLIGVGFGSMCPNLGGWPTGLTMSGSAGAWTLSAPLTYTFVNANGVTQTASFALVQGAAPSVGLPVLTLAGSPKPTLATPPTVPTYGYTDPVTTLPVTAAYIANLSTGVLSNPANPAVVLNPGTAPTPVAAPIVTAGTPSTNSKGIALTQPDGSPIMVVKEVGLVGASTVWDHTPVKDALGNLVKVQAYGYDKPHYLGPVVLATKGKAVRMKYVNALPTGRAVTNADGSVTRNGDLFLPVDETLTGAGYGPDGLTKYTQNRTALHWHGGDTPWISDGTPHQWIVPADDEQSLPADYARGVSQANVPDMADPGPGAETLYWPNNMGARLMFYHDHALAITRLNVYGGAAAGYVLTDTVEAALTKPATQSTVFAAGDVNTIDGLAHTVLGAGLPPLTDEIPLVIQDKTFVPNDIAAQDALWDTQHWGSEGDLWFPHVYEINQNPAMIGNGTNPVGRWDYGPWFWPVFPAPLQLPTGAYGDATTTPEGFMDTPLVNGTAYPTVNVDPKAYRLRVLNAGNDRMLNLSFFVADPTVTTADGRTGTEVKMVPFISPNGVTQVTYVCPDGVSAGMTVGAKNANGTVLAPGWTESGLNASGVVLYPNSFPCAGGLDGTGWGQADNRPGGVPFPGVPNALGVADSNVSGPHFIQIGNEGGLLPNPVDIAPSIVNYEYNKRSVTVLNVLERGLFLGGAERADVVVDFSAYAGKTLILYNDSPAPLPAGDPRIDYYTDDGDQTGAGGAPNTLAGFGPNTRTVMQFKVNATATTAAAPFVLGTPAVTDPATNVVTTAPTGLYAALPTAYAASQEKPFVTESAYNNAFNTANGDSYGTIFAGSSIQPNFVFTPTTVTTQTLKSISLVGQGVGYTVAPDVVLSGGGLAAPITIKPSATQGAQIAGGKVTSIIVPAATLTAATGLKTAPTVKLVSNPNASGIAVGQGASALAITDQTQSVPAQMKAIQELFDPSYGRMNATLGVELPFTSPLNQTTIPLGYIDPTTEDIPENQIQIWKITHNGVDTHPVHFHLFNLQVINRVGWDGTIKPPYDNEQGWKETLKMNPLEDVYVAVKPRTPVIPFGVKDSVRRMDPSQPLGAITGFTQVDPKTGAAPIDPITGLTMQIVNASKSYGWEYVWHCHILGHEENDFMRPINFAYTSAIPDAPAPLTAAGFVAAGGPVTLTWNDLTPATAATTPGNKKNEIGFKIMRSPSGGAAFVQVGTALANSTSFVDVAPASAVGYNYQVIAYNQAGDSIAASATVGTAVAALAPAAPTTAAATVNTPYQITLTWLDNSPSAANATLETGFVIQRAVVTGGAIGAYTTIATAPADTTVCRTGGRRPVVTPCTETYVDTTAQPSTTYSYRVAAANGATLSAWAVAANRTTGAAPNLTAPSNVAVQYTGINAAGVTTASVSFTDLASSETLYVVQVSSDSGKSWGDGTNTTATQAAPAYVATLTRNGGVVAGTGGAVTINVNNANLVMAAGNTPYLFRVAAATGTAATPGVIGAWGNIATIDLSGQTVIAPASGFTAAPASATTATLSWVDNANNNSGYTLEYLNGANWTAVTIGGNTGVRIGSALGGAATSVLVSGLTSGTTYQFRLQAVIAGTTNASPYATTSLTMAAPAIPAAPTFSVGSVTATGLTLNWAATPGAASYTVQRSTSATGPWANVASGVTANTLAVTGLAANTTYYFHVSATNSFGTTAYSSASAGQLTLPATPTVTAAAVTMTGLTLNWAAGAGVTYAVTGTGGTIVVGNGTATVTGLTASTSYTFTVVGTNATGASAAGTVTVTTAAALPAPATPTAPSSTRGNGGNPITSTLAWTAPANAASYNVVWSTSATALNAVTGTTTPASAGGNAGVNVITAITGVSYTFTAPGSTATTVGTIPANTTVYFKIQAVNATGNSAWSAAFNSTVR